MIKPKTKPSQSDVNKMRQMALILIEDFGGISQFSSLFKFKYGTVNGWLTRGRIPAHIADSLCQCSEVKKLGWTRSSLRPDIILWRFDEK